MKDDVATNVTLKDEESKEFFPCPICNEMLEVGYTKRSKPYCTCNHCGVQLFVRGRIGIKRFLSLISDFNYKAKSKELIDLIDYFEKLKEKLNKIRKNKPIIGKNEDLNIQEKAIKKQLNNLRKKLESI